MAHSYGRGVLKPGQAVVISAMEHHSNIVPWQLLRDDRGIELRVAPITDAGELDMAAFEALLADGKVGLVSITHMSNVLGTVHAGRTHRAHRPRAWREGAVRRLPGGGASRASTCRRWTAISTPGPGTSCTARPASACCGGGANCWSAMPPFLGGGEMISSVTYEQSTWAEVPHKFEAGTPPILEGIGLKAAIDYVQAIGYDAIAAHEAVAGRPRAGAAVGDRGRAHPRQRAGSRRRGVASRSTGRTRTTWRRCSTARASRCAPAITAPSR